MRRLGLLLAALWLPALAGPVQSRGQAPPHPKATAVIKGQGMEPR